MGAESTLGLRAWLGTVTRSAECYVAVNELDRMLKSSCHFLLPHEALRKPQSTKNTSCLGTNSGHRERKVLFVES
jgi:hypothetical protein